MRRAAVRGAAPKGEFGGGGGVPASTGGASGGADSVPDPAAGNRGGAQPASSVGAAHARVARALDPGRDTDTAPTAAGPEPRYNLSLPDGRAAPKSKRTRLSARARERRLSTKRACGQGRLNTGGAHGLCARQGQERGRRRRARSFASQRARQGRQGEGHQASALGLVRWIVYHARPDSKPAFVAISRRVSPGRLIEYAWDRLIH